jgi:excisionase family DNA binding protein
MSKDLPTLMSLKEVAFEARLSVQSVRRQIDANKLVSKKIGKRRLIHREDFEKWVGPSGAAQHADR